MEKLYDELRYLITKNDADEENKLIDEYGLSEKLIDSLQNLIIEVEKVLQFGSLSNDNSKIQDNRDPILSKCWYLCFEVFDLLGVTKIEWVEDLLNVNKLKVAAALEDNLRMITGEDKQKDQHYLENALIQVRIFLRLIEQHYKMNDWESVRTLVKNLRTPIFANLISKPKYRPLFMLALTQQTFMELQAKGLIGASQKEIVGVNMEDSFSSSTSKEIKWIKKLPEEAAIFLSLNSRIALCLGKVNIRQNNFASAEKSFEESVRSMLAWKHIRKLQIQDLRKTDGERYKSEKRFVDNYTLNRVALTQSMVGFCLYRQGLFQSSVLQLIPARLTLDKSCWVFTRIFSDIVYASAERRIAGLQNDRQLFTSKRVNQKIINYLTNPKNILGIDNKEQNKEGKDQRDNLEPDPTFLIRSMYEMGTIYIYIAEQMERDIDKHHENKLSDSSPDEIESLNKEYQSQMEKIEDKLSKAKRNADDIINRLDAIANNVQILKQKNTSHFDLFWRANAYHILAFVDLKKAVLRRKSEQIVRSFNNDSIQKIEKLFKDAFNWIEKAQLANTQAESQWQKVEILTDRSYMYIEGAVFYEMVGNKEKRIFLAKEALLTLDDAWEAALVMAKGEKSSFSNALEMEPKPNFAGPINLFRSMAFILLKNQEMAWKYYEAWKKLELSGRVEYTRIRDLAEGVEGKIKKIDNAFVLEPGDEENLNYAKQERRLKEWLLEYARQGRTDTQAMKTLGISRATYYAWKADLGKNKKE